MLRPREASSASYAGGTEARISAMIAGAGSLESIARRDSTALAQSGNSDIRGYRYCQCCGCVLWLVFPPVTKNPEKGGQLSLAVTLVRDAFNSARGGPRQNLASKRTDRERTNR